MLSAEIKKEGPLHSISPLALIFGICCIFSMVCVCGCLGGWSSGSEPSHDHDCKNPGSEAPPAEVPGEIAIPAEIAIEVPTDYWGKLPLARIETEEGRQRPKIRAILEGCCGRLHILCLRALADGDYQIGYLVWDWQSAHQQPADQELLEPAVFEPVARVKNYLLPALNLTCGDSCPVAAWRGGRLLRGCSEDEGEQESQAMLGLRAGGVWSSCIGAEGEEGEIGSLVRLAGAEVSIIADSQGYIHLGYQQVSENCQDKSNLADLYYLKKHRFNLKEKVSAQMVEEDQGSGPHIFGAHCAIILDDSEQPVIFHFAQFSDQSQGLRMARKRSDGTWQREWVEQGCEVGCISCARDKRSKRIGVAYYVKSYTPGGIKHCLRYASAADGQFSSWELMMVDDSAECGDYCSLAFDSEGCPVIAYYEMKAKSGYPLKNLKLAYLKADFWAREVVASEGDIGLDNNLYLDDDNRAFICSYSATEKMLYLFYRDLTYWYD